MDNIPFEIKIYIILLISEAISSFIIVGGKNKISNLSYGESRIKQALRWPIGIVFFLSSLYLIIKTFYAVFTKDVISVVILIPMLAFALLFFIICKKISHKAVSKREEAYTQKYLNKLNKKMIKKYSQSPIVNAAAERFKSDSSLKELRVFKNGIAFYRTSSKIPSSVSFKSNAPAHSKLESEKIVKSMAKEWEDKIGVIYRKTDDIADAILYSNFGYEDASQEVRYGLTVCLTEILDLPHGFYLGTFEHYYKDIKPSTGYIISANGMVSRTGGSVKEYRSEFELSAYGIVHTPPQDDEKQVSQNPPLKHW